MAPENINKSIYALPEITKNKVKKFKIISCPGCYPTTILLPLLPLLKKNLIKSKNIIIDSKSGYSGAGRGVHKKFKDKNLYESLSVYGIPTHRHISEIQQELNKYINKKVKFLFTPHLSPMFIGILTTMYLETKNNINTEKYSEFNIQPQPGLIDNSVEGITTSDQYNKIQKIKSDSEQNLKDINSVKGQLKNVDDKISNLNNQITDLRLIRAKQVENLEKLKQYYNS